jgi:hypothetical protein
MSSHLKNSDSSFADLVLSIVMPEIDRRDAERPPARSQPSQLDDKTLERIRLYELISRKPYLTKAEAALYLDVSEKSRRGVVCARGRR